MKRSARFAAAAALVSAFLSGSASAQSAPRDGRVEQAIADTFGAAAARRGLDSALSTVTRDAIFAALAARCAAGFVGRPSPKTFLHCLEAMALLGDLPQPVDVGSGSFGGGGATGSWMDCDDIDFRLDVVGDLIIPSVQLKTGGPMPLNTNIWYTGGAFPACPPGNIGDTSDAALRRAIHCRNIGEPDRRKWWGVVVREGTGVWAAGVAFRDETNTLWSRNASFLNSAQYYYSRTQGIAQADAQPCPQTQGGGGVHFYGASDGPYVKIKQCIHYIPDESLGPDGYAIAPFVSEPMQYIKGWPNTYIPAELRDCPIDPQLIRLMTEAAWQEASRQPGYTGAPPGTEPSDARPGDTTVGDLTDTPSTQSEPPEPNPNTPPPTTPTQPTTGYKDECDFGATGCTDPGTPSPTLEATPSGIMDPIFEWLPDLPSITFDANASECPVWAVNLTEFGGPEWQFLIDKQCPLLEDNRAAIGALMIALFGMAAALVILRA